MNVITFYLLVVFYSWNNSLLFFCTPHMAMPFISAMGKPPYFKKLVRGNPNDPYTFFSAMHLCSA